MSTPLDEPLAVADPEVAAILTGELRRQQEGLEMIASENFVSRAVMQAQGSVLTNKYAEGYPGRRYYGGCAWVDKAETLAIERAKSLFGADYANVQPHSGASANAAVYHAMVKPGAKVLGMALDQGGHLTHGMKLNFSGRNYDVAAYHVNPETYLLDMDEVRETALRERPAMIIAGWSAYPRQLDFAAFRSIADEVGAVLWTDMAHFAGLVAAGLHPNPLPYSDVVTTTIHKTLGGPRSGMILSARGEEYGKKLNSAVFPGAQGGPLEHVIAAKAVCFKEALQPEFKTYQQQVLKNAQSMAQVFLDRGFDVVSGGTQNHLFLLSLIKQDITGKDADAALGRAFITVNKNSVPNDPRSPFVTSGLRIGTPAVTTRGFKEAECRELAGWICDILENMGDESVVDGVREKVKAICAKFPVYGN